MTDPKAVALRFYELINDGAVDRLGEVCSPDLRGHAGAGADLAELQEALGSFVEAFPDLRVVPRYLVREDDLVSTWVTYTGTHRGDYAGVPGTGRQVKIAGWDLIRVVDDRIVEITQYCDVFTLMNQIGALPTTTTA
jgi:steroid delta-isomerase-like uncharacterized protein